MRWNRDVARQVQAHLSRDPIAQTPINFIVRNVSSLMMPDVLGAQNRREGPPKSGAVRTCGGHKWRRGDRRSGGCGCISVGLGRDTAGIKNTVDLADSHLVPDRLVYQPVGYKIRLGIFVLALYFLGTSCPWVVGLAQLPDQPG